MTLPLGLGGSILKPNLPVTQSPTQADKPDLPGNCQCSFAEGGHWHSDAAHWQEHYPASITEHSASGGGYPGEGGPGSRIQDSAWGMGANRPPLQRGVACRLGTSSIIKTAWNPKNFCVGYSQGNPLCCSSLCCSARSGTAMDLGLDYF
jgi:hypothetical protein